MDVDLERLFPLLDLLAWLATALLGSSVDFFGGGYFWCVIFFSLDVCFAITARAAGFIQLNTCNKTGETTPENKA